MQVVPLAQEMISPIRVVESPGRLTTPQRERRRALVIPREHGAWGMLLFLSNWSDSRHPERWPCYPGVVVDDGCAYRCFG